MRRMRLSVRTDPEILREIGRRLRALRRAAGLTAAEAAEGAGLSRRTVHRAEAGQNPTLASVVRLLRLYGRLEDLAGLFAEPEISPMALVRRDRER